MQKAIGDRGGIPKIRCLAARREPDVEIEVSLAETASSETSWRYAIGIKQAVRGYRNPYLTYENVWAGGELILNQPDHADEKDRLRLTQTHLEQISLNQQFREISKFFESVQYLHLVPQLVRYPGALPGPGIHGDPYGRNFLERVARTPGGLVGRA